MSRMNCWEFEECGRQPGGKNEKTLGTCPASLSTTIDGINDGHNGGRACWAIAGTLCGGKTQGSYAEKLGNCLRCDFYTFVRYQQREKFVNTRKILDIISGKITISCIVKPENSKLRDAV